MNLTQIRCSGLSMPFWTKIKNSNSLNYAEIEIQLIMYISCVSDGGNEVAGCRLHYGIREMK